MTELCIAEREKSDRGVGLFEAREKNRTPAYTAPIFAILATKKDGAGGYTYR